ncbi:MAG TPA: hypothetical protein VLA35_03285 [Thermoleophilia bacterium]|nr:hypothetical protein [Thermoleophilia bacterium]
MDTGVGAEKVHLRIGSAPTTPREPRATRPPESRFCSACFGDEHSISVPEE